MRHNTRCFTASKPTAPRAMASRAGGSDVDEREHFHQLQNLHELALALAAPSGLPEDAGVRQRTLPATASRPVALPPDRARC